MPGPVVFTTARFQGCWSTRGVASRREAERLIEAGEVTVNGKIITSPALNVTDADLITISGHPLPRMETARLWLYYKPDGLVTSAGTAAGLDCCLYLVRQYHGSAIANKVCQK
jgi:16S rRNA U516 pseudouridylate synthase RsuA-like enzyme